MNTYKIQISYIGSSYQGWQVQPDSLKTIQGQINHALEKIAKSGEVSSIGSGRTDSGVHAIAQVAKISLPLEINPENLQKALNSHLPADIRILKANHCKADFHPVRDALWKRYAYYLYIGEILPPGALKRVTLERAVFDLENFKLALKEFVGTHDFKNFSTKGTEVKSTVRTIFKSNIEKVEGFFPYQDAFDGDVYKVTFEGNGFLKQMVRLLVGSSLMAARGKIVPRDINTFFQEDRSDKLGPVAAADGLYLEHVEYKSQWCSSN